MKKRIICLMLVIVMIFSLSACQQNSKEEAPSLSLEKTGSLELEYATRFSVDYYEGGYKLISTANSRYYLVIPEGKQAPDDLDERIIPLYQPLDNIYLAATSAMSLFDAIDGIGYISFSGTNADGWSIENAKKALEDGSVKFAGKYSEPDYEQLANEECCLAIESTMILHTPEVQDKLETIGIPVFIDISSEEAHPMGRVEWIKLYAALLDKEDEAKKVFDDQTDYMDSVSFEGDSTGKSVVYFYISTTNIAMVRAPGDYIDSMIKLAGGVSAFEDMKDDASGTNIKLDMESFYEYAKDADILIYNCQIDTQTDTLDEFLAKSELFSEFKAVKEGNIWYTSRNIYQETTNLGKMILDLNRIFTGNYSDGDMPEYFDHLK